MNFGFFLENTIIQLETRKMIYVQRLALVKESVKRIEQVQRPCSSGSL